MSNEQSQKGGFVLGLITRRFRFRSPDKRDPELLQLAERDLELWRTRFPS